MTALYNKSLQVYGKAYKAVQFYLLQMGLAFGLTKAIEQLKEAEHVAMLQNLELLISNIKESSYAFELKACKDMYQVLCLSYPEFPVLYNSLVWNAIDRQEQIITNSFNK